MNDRMYRLFGHRVRALREARQITQDDLAKRVDLSRTSITNIEQGRQRVLLHQVIDLAKALDADPTELMASATVADEPLTPRVAKLVKVLRGETAPKA